MRLLGKALTFDDVLLVPAFSQVLPRDTSLATSLSRNIRLNLPLVSAAMDTVTEARLAIAIAQEGGIGIVHKNMSPKEQAAEVAKVKRFESGVLRDPITVTPDMKVRQVIDLSEQLGVSGFPVVEAARWSASSPTATCASRPGYDVPVSDIMTPRDKPGDRARGHDPCRRQGADAQAPARARAGGQRRLRAARPDHRQGHHQADQFPERGARCARPAARRRGGGRRRGHRRAGRGAGRGRRRRDRGRYRARPQQGRDRAGALGQAATIRRST